MDKTRTAEKLHFTYSSIENIVRLLITVRFENSKDAKDITIFHQRFDNEPDETFRGFLEEVFPNGGELGTDEIDNLVEYIYAYMQREDKCRDLYVEYDKRRYSSYVYFIPDKDLRYADTGRHAGIVQAICCDYFKGFDDEIDLSYLKRFISENFEIKSDFSTLERILLDAEYIKDQIDLQRAIAVRRSQPVNEWSEES